MIRKLLVVAVLWMATIVQAQGADTFDFVIIQPGQPGSSQDAQPVMDALAAYVQKKLGNGVTVKGHYFNQSAPATAFLTGNHPRWGIVSLDFFLSYGGTKCMVPLAATRPGGSDNDTWRLVVAKGGPDDWQDVQGRVEGTMLFGPTVAARLVFNRSTGELPFTLEGTYRPLRALRNVLRGKSAAVLLDKPQYDAVQALPYAADLKEIASSGDLPTPAVVAFGKPGRLHQRLGKILQDMQGDPAAADLLMLLQTKGFGPADERLAALKEKGV